ncbi:MAG: AAA family ATPase [Deltaproteobacteria bacterium]|nr:AAA family ATPase [Deltaproteobacteria bacterium]
MPNKKSATRLSANILNYFAAFTETRFNFRILINYRWTDNELTLDLGIFQDFQDELLQRIKTGDSTVGTIYLFFHELNRRTDNDAVEGYPIFFIELNLSPGAEKVEVLFPRDLLLINTPAVNYSKFPSVLTASRSSTLKNAVSNLSGMEVFLQAQYGWNEPFVLEPYFRPIKAPKETYPDIRCRVGFQVVRNENKKLLDYSEIMTRLESDEKNKFVDFISDYIDGNVENTQDAVDREFIEKYPIKSAGRYISDNPLNLNISQKRILLALNKPKNKIVVVDGPPGTGKSHTIRAITYWTNQEGKSVVITSHKKQAKNGRSINTLEKFLQNAVINAAGDRANDYNEQAVEQDEKELKKSVTGKIEKQISSSGKYREKIHDLGSRIKNGFKGSVGIITSFREQQARMEQILNEKLNMPELKRNHDLAIWFVGDVQGEERDIVYYSFVEDSKYGNADLRNIYPVIDGTADNIRKLKMQRLNVGFSRAKDTMVFVHSMPVN